MSVGQEMCCVDEGGARLNGNHSLPSDRQYAVDAHWTRPSCRDPRRDL